MAGKTGVILHWWSQNAPGVYGRELSYSHQQEDRTEHSGSKCISHIINQLTIEEREYINPSLFLTHNEPRKPWARALVSVLPQNLTPYKTKGQRNPIIAVVKEKHPRLMHTRSTRWFFIPLPKLEIFHYSMDPKHLYNHLSCNTAHLWPL